jgi:transposase-like protein
MPPSNLTHSSSWAIMRPPCPQCGTTMMLARIEPHTPGCDMRTFECPSCNHSESEVVHFK